MASRIIKDEVFVIDNTNRGLDNCRYHAKTESNNCLLCIQNQKKELYKWNTRKFHAKFIRTTFF